MKYPKPDLRERFIDALPNKRIANILRYILYPTLYFKIRRLNKYFDKNWDLVKEYEK